MSEQQNTYPELTNHDLMVRYIDDDLSPEDKAAYEKIIKQNPNLEETINYFRSLNRTIIITIATTDSPRSSRTTTINTRRPSLPMYGGND